MHASRPQEDCHHIRIVGPRESRSNDPKVPLIWTVSKAETDWQRELSPFHLGPVPLYDGTRAVSMENAWQFAKVYAAHVDGDGAIKPDYWRWARRGWNSQAIRYPMGKGAKPLFSLWAGERLGYVEARKQVYWRLYRDAVRQTDGWRRLVEHHEKGPIALFDFDGFDHDAARMTLADVIEQTARPMGHAFVLKAMLMHGTDVEAADMAALSAATPLKPSPQPAQAGLFDDFQPSATVRLRPR